MIIGSALDCLIFDGAETFGRRFPRWPRHREELPGHFVAPPDSFTGYKKADKVWVADQKKSGRVIVKPADWASGVLSPLSGAGRAWKAWTKASGRHVLSADDMRSVRDAAEAVQRHPVAGLMLAEGAPQVSAVWECQQTGVTVKIRPDMVMPAPTLADLKKTVDASPEKFAIQVFKMRYHWQAAMYLDGMSAATGEHYDEFLFIAVEEDPPHRCEVYRLGMAEIEQGREEYRAALQAYADHNAVGSWPTSTGKIQDLRFPAWAAR
jgi:hypothetical protein